MSDEKSSNSLVKKTHRKGIKIRINYELHKYKKYITVRLENHTTFRWK